MDSPAVYIEREPLLTMLFAAVEVCNRECYGVLFGSSPSRSRDFYHVRAAVVLQAVVRRTNGEVVTSTRADYRTKSFLENVGRLYPPLIGDFHSHPPHPRVERTPGLSEGDAKDMVTRDGRRRPLGVVIRIAKKGKRTASWRRHDRKTRLRGSLGIFTFDLMAFRIVGEGKEGKPEALAIEIAPSTRKALNRARRS